MRFRCRAIRRIILFGLVLVAAGPLDAQERRPLTVDAFLALKTVGDPRPSPDGDLVAYTVSTISLKDNRSVSRIHLVEVASGRSRELATGDGSARAPRWTSDGKSLAFISTADGGPQIWRVVIDSGRPAKVTSVPGGVGDFVAAPDGKSFYFTSDVKWPATQEIDDRNGEFPTDARIWTDLYYRHWNEWRVGMRQHLSGSSWPMARSPT
jgi:Tol biopolymer transport system component